MLLLYTAIATTFTSASIYIHTAKSERGIFPITKSKNKNTQTYIACLKAYAKSLFNFIFCRKCKKKLFELHKTTKKGTFWVLIKTSSSSSPASSC